jgi:GTP-binding protein
MIPALRRRLPATAFASIDRRPMKIKSAVFEISAAGPASYPAAPLPEFAFIGRSNVGKSSLINLLTERRELAKVSDTPGKTKLMNFFRINDTWRLVDLPGYGFAKVGKNDRADFNEAAADYLEHRENLARVFVLIDSRLPPQRIDLDFLNWLATCPVASALIFTKVDKQPSQVHANIAAFKKCLLGAALEIPESFTSSTTTRKGTRYRHFIRLQKFRQRGHVVRLRLVGDAPLLARASEVRVEPGHDRLTAGKCRDR